MEEVSPNIWIRVLPNRQSQVCMREHDSTSTASLLRTPNNDDFIGCCTSPVYLILGSIWDPLLPDPAFDRHFPSYWMDRLKTSMIAKSGKDILFLV